MFGNRANTILYFAMGELGIFAIGLSAPKILIYGSLITGLIWSSSPLLPGYIPVDAAGMSPHFFDILTPRAFDLAITTGGANYGLLGSTISILVLALLTIPYFSECYLGIRCYSQFFPFHISI